MNKSKIALAVAGALAASTAADAATHTIRLTGVVSFSNNGISVPVLLATGDDWIYDDVAQTVTAGSTYDAQYNVAINPIFRHTINGYVIDVSGTGTAAATDYTCVEGVFGGIVGASICGNYNLGANYVNESTTVWGPGTATSKTIGGDDVDIGPMQDITQNDGFAVVSFDGSTLVISNSATIAPPTESPNTGYDYTFVVPGDAVDDPNYAAAQGSSGTSLDVGANDVRWSPNPTVVDDASGTATGTGSAGGTFVVTANADIASVTASYTPVNAMFTGTETWVYRVTDTEGPLVGQSDTATVTVNVSMAGTAADDTGATTSLSNPVAISVGQNDVGFADPSTVTITTAATQGTTTIAGSPGPKDAITVTYESTAPLYSAGYTDVFSYEISDGAVTDTADVTVTVNNTVPVAGDLGGVTLDTQGVSPADASTDVDVGPAGDIAGNELGDAPSTVTTAPANDVTTAVTGTVITLTASTFTSAGDAVGYTIADTDTEEATGTIAVSIPDVAPTVQDASRTVVSAGGSPIAVGYQLGNGASSDHTASVSPAPQWGTVSDIEINDTTREIEFVYTPTGFAAVDTFGLQMNDGDGSAGTGTITVTITGDAVTIPPQDTLPGNANATGPASLAALLLGIPLLRRWRRKRRS